MSALKQRAERGASSAKGWAKQIRDRKERREARAAYRTEMSSIASVISQDEALSPSTVVPPLAADADLLLMQAREELLRVHGDMVVNEQRRQELLYKLLGRIYALTMDSKRNDDRHRQRLARARVKVRADTPFHKQTVRALLVEAGITVKKSTEHEWSQVVTALEHDGVVESEAAVVQWLTEEAVVNGAACRGFNRAEATLRGSKKLKNAARQKRQERDAEERATFTAAVTANSRFGTIEPLDDATCPTGLWLSLNRDGDVLRMIPLTEKELRALVLKHAREH